MRQRLLLLLALGLFAACAPTTGPGNVTGPTGETTPYPILFVTQVPIPADYTTIGAVFGNHDPALQRAGRGGDLWIRYEDGALRNLTAAAGHGHDGFQGAAAIAVRDPSVHWSGTKALFAMVVGAPEERYLWETYYWQLYEITGLGPSDTPVITRLPSQPANFNNVTPLYDPADNILFTSDRPRNGAAHLYPQLDEYETAPTVTGIWRLDVATGELTLLNHAPSGNFTPSVDSYGRIIFTQWDHLQRDQQADSDALTPPGDPEPYGTFNYSDESANAVPLFGDRTEVFPEPRPARTDLLAGSNLAGHTFNHFFPWQMNPDGTELETLIHIGRQELHHYLAGSRTDDPNVVEYYGQYPRFNPHSIENMLQVREDPTVAGRYIGSNAPEFYTHAAGQVVALAAPPDQNPDTVAVDHLTHPDTADTSDNPSPDHSGLYRDPLPLSDGRLLAVHTAETRADYNAGDRAFPQSLYDFRLTLLAPAGNGYLAADIPLTPAITKNVSYWDPDVLVSYDGPLWQLQPVEVRPRPRPTAPTAVLPDPEAEMFAAAGVDVAQFVAFLRSNDLALAVSRNVTTRDDLDRQQPFNLRVPGGVETIGATGTVYDIAFQQFFQADQLRGWTGGGSEIRAGRRVLAQALHEPTAVAYNLPAPGGPPGSVAIAADGSTAAFLPAGRALTWQLTDPAGTGVVRERYWLTFQPGEIRVCASCHGLNEYDQAGATPPTNPPQALLALLEAWQAVHDLPPVFFVPMIAR